MPEMEAPRPGLRPVGVRLVNKSNGVAKVGIIVAAGAELRVDEDVAGQLLRQSAAFATIDDVPGGSVVAAEAEGATAAPSASAPLIEEAGGSAARRSSGRRKAEG